MKVFNLPLLIAITLLMSSCSMPVTFWLFNNTGYAITVITDEDELAIEAGDSDTATGLDYALSIRSETGYFEYETGSIPLSHVHWIGWGPFSKRMLYVQLESDGKIWILGAKPEPPIASFIQQPEGFPLEPNT